MTGITAYGAYIPRLRLQRKAVAQANAWFAPGLLGGAKGERAMANFDEDAVTMAVEAGARLPARVRSDQGPRVCRCGLFRLDQHAVLRSPECGHHRQRAEPVRRYFVARCFVLAARRAFGTHRGAGRGESRRVRKRRWWLRARNARRARPRRRNSLMAMRLRRDGRQRQGHREISRQPFGDARFRRSFSRRRRRVRLRLGRALDPRRGLYQDRARRDQGAVREDRRQAAPTSRISFCHVPSRSSTRQLAKQSGIDPAKVRDNLAATVGDAGSAHALLMLAHALEQAKPGEKILVAQFGQGCDALLFEVTPEIAGLSKRNGVSGALARRKEETNYNKFLGFNGLIELEKGMRAEVDKRTALTVALPQERHADGSCRRQMPRLRHGAIPQDPHLRQSELQGGRQPGSLQLRGPGRHDPVLVGGFPHLFDVAAQSLRHDHLCRRRALHESTSPMWIRDRSIRASKVKMVFRVKDVDEKRGFKRYFWKAAPV